MFDTAARRMLLSTISAFAIATPAWAQESPVAATQPAAQPVALHLRGSSADGAMTTGDVPKACWGNPQRLLAEALVVGR